MLGRYLAGLVLLAISFGPIVLGARAWRDRLVPRWGGAPARLAEAVLGIAAVIVTAEVLGAVHLFSLAPVVIGLVLVGVGGWWAAGHRWAARPPAHRDSAPSAVSGRPEPTRLDGDGGGNGGGNGGGGNGGGDEDGGGAGPEGGGASPPWAAVAAVVATGVVVADWSTRVVAAYRHGMASVDTLWYHLPFAARFVQTGTITPIHYVDGGPVTAFFPASSELVHALGMLLMGTDLLSPLVNLGWLALALLAGWCIGRPFGVAPLTLVGVAVVMATPGLQATQPGGAYDDVVGLSLLLASVALLVQPRVRRPVAGPALVLAAMAAGVAVGTKYTLLAPVGMLTVMVVVVARRGERLRTWWAWSIPLTVTGAFWYIRNLVAVGNPLPSLHLTLGPFSLPSPPANAITSTVAHFLFDGTAWRVYFLPGLRLSFGPVWWALLGLSVVGMVAGVVVAPDALVRALAVASVVTGLAFLVTPQFLTAGGAPVFFVDNARYADPALLLGLCLLPLSPLVAPRRRRWWLLAAYGAVLTATQLDGTLWPTSLPAHPFAPPVRGADALAGVVLGAAVTLVALASIFGDRRGPRRRASGRERAVRPMPAGRPDPRRATLTATVVVIAALVAGGFALQQSYLRRRYTDIAPMPVIYAWARQVQHARIGVYGTFAQLQYPLYGDHLDNWVQYLGVSGPHGAYGPFRTCAQWRRAIDAGHYGFVVVSSGLQPNRPSARTRTSAEGRWTSSDPAAHLIVREIQPITGQFTGFVGFSLFRVTGPMRASSCSGSGSLR